MHREKAIEEIGRLVILLASIEDLLEEEYCPILTVGREAILEAIAAEVRIVNYHDEKAL